MKIRKNEDQKKMKIREKMEDQTHCVYACSMRNDEVENRNQVSAEEKEKEKEKRKMRVVCAIMK